MSSRNAATSSIHHCTPQLLSHSVILLTGTPTPATLTRCGVYGKAAEAPCGFGRRVDGHAGAPLKKAGSPEAGRDCSALRWVICRGFTINQLLRACAGQGAPRAPWADRSEMCSLQASITGCPASCDLVDASKPVQLLLKCHSSAVPARLAADACHIAAQLYWSTL